MSTVIRPLDHLPLAGAGGDAALLIPKGETISFAGLEARTGRLAAWLKERCEAGARVASWLPKGALSSILPLAAARAGLVYVPVNPVLKRAQVAHILTDSGATLFLTQPSRAALLEAGDLPDDAEMIADGIASAVMADEGQPGLPPSDASADTLCEILYTSGSTGRPKGVMLSHANLSLGADAVADYLAIRPEDRTLCVLPFSFDYGQNQLFSTWRGGACAVPFDYLLPRDVAKAVAAHGITTLAGVPPLWVQLVEIDWPEGAGDSLKRLTNSGGALTRPLIGRMAERFPGADIYPMYGLTEAFRSTYLSPDLVASHPDSMGRAIPHAEILVIGADGDIADRGELVHCGPLVAQGYWRDAERTAQRFRPAPAASRYGGTAVWSGDTVRRDGEGLLYFVGRDDAMIKSAGNRISPTEIEEAAVAAPGVAEAVALGIADERLGQAIRLYVRLAEPEDGVIQSLQAALRRDLPNFMQPREIVAVADLPRNANGKIDRVALAEGTA